MIPLHVRSPDILRPQQFLPPIIPKVRPVVQQPLHTLRIIVRHRRSWIPGFPTYALARPDGIRLGRLGRIDRLRLVVVGSQRIDAGFEVRQQPRGRLRAARAQKPDAVEEVVQARRQRLERQRARRVQQDQPVDRFAVGQQLGRDFVCDDAAGGPAAHGVGPVRLAAPDLGHVDG